MFCVYDNNKPADETGFPPLNGYGWTNSKFKTFEDAHVHALKWLGPGWENLKLELNIPYDYSGYGDTILIVEDEPGIQIERRENNEIIYLTKAEAVELADKLQKVLTHILHLV